MASRNGIPKADENLTAEYLRRFLHYDPLTGIFTRIASVTRPDLIGKLVGGTHGHGYTTIYIAGTPRLAHRLAWLYVHGEWPKSGLDHIDGNPKNNAIANLRDVSQQWNVQNRTKAMKTSKTGLLGASPTRGGRFGAFIRVDGKTKNLGTFDTAQEAHEAHVAAKRLLHPGCTI